MVPESDRGWFRWVIVAANFFITIALWTPWAAYGVFLGPLAEDLRWQRGAADIAFSIVLVMGAPLGLAVGKIIDRYGPGKLAVIEVMFCSAAFLLASTMQELWQLYVYLGVMQGCSFAGAYLIPAATTARWFDHNRGLALSIVMSGSGIAYIVGPLLTVRLMEAYGWRGTFLVIGTGVAILGILPALFLRNPQEAPVYRKSDDPTSRSGPGSPRQGAPTPITLKGALFTLTLWLLILVALTQAFAQMMFVLHFVPMKVHKGLDIAAAASAMSSYGLGLLVGRIVSGPLSDRIGALTVLVGMTIFASLGLVIMLGTEALPLLYAATFIFGFTMSGADNAYIRAMPDIVGTGALGLIMSVTSIGWRLGGAAGPVVAGFLFDATKVYAIPFSIAIAVLLLSSVLFVAASRPERNLERIPTQKQGQRS